VGSEYTIFKTLPDKTAILVTEIAQRAYMPRTTTTDVLKRLHSYGIARKVRKGSRTVWKRSSISARERYIQRVRTAIGADVPNVTTEGSKIAHLSSGMTVSMINGVSALEKVYERACSCNPYERMCLTQSPEALMEMLKKRQFEAIQTSNTKTQTHHGIMEITMTESTKRAYAQFARTYPQWIEGLSGIMIDISVVPDNVLPHTPSELFIFRDEVLLTDWKEETGVLIKDASLATMLRHLFRAAKSLGETFNNARFIASLEAVVSKA
jgi:hypothetical protein